MIRNIILLLFLSNVGLAGCVNYQLLPIPLISKKPANTCVRTLGTVTFVRRAAAIGAAAPRIEQFIDQQKLQTAIDKRKAQLESSTEAVGPPPNPTVFSSASDYVKALVHWRGLQADDLSARHIEPEPNPSDFIDRDAYNQSVEAWRSEYRFEIVDGQDRSIMVQASEEPYTGETVEVYGTIGLLEAMDDLGKGKINTEPDIQAEKFLVVKGALPSRSGWVSYRKSSAH